MADTTFVCKEYQGKKYLVAGSDWRYQVDSGGYIWDADGKAKIGYLKEEWWHGERWHKVVVNNSQQGWVKM